jgi:hypothetical protein
MSKTIDNSHQYEQIKLKELKQSERFLRKSVSFGPMIKQECCVGKLLNVCIEKRNKLAKKRSVERIERVGMDNNSIIA